MAHATLYVQYISSTKEDPETIVVEVLPVLPPVFSSNPFAFSPILTSPSSSVFPSEESHWRSLFDIFKTEEVCELSYMEEVDFVEYMSDSLVPLLHDDGQISQSVVALLS